MSDDAPDAAPEASSETETPPSAPKAPPYRRRPLRLAVVTFGWVVLALAIVAGIARFGVLTDPGRAFAARMLNGISLGSYGRLHIEGLQGDVWRDFTVRRLTLEDDRGDWLDGRDLHVRWDWPALLSQQLSVGDAQARLVTILRAPVVKPTGASGGSQYGVHLARLQTRLELLPAFSQRYGLYDVGGALDLKRGGGLAGYVTAASLTHAGDRMDANFDLGRDKTIKLALGAREAGGGAMAGSFGLAADQPFFVSAKASGTTSAGQFNVTSRSGALTPIAGAGAWRPEGGSASGVITLAATRLLSGYQRMLGPTAQFRIDGARAADGLTALDISATSENVDITAKGEADVDERRTGTNGLAMTIVARQAKRVIGWPEMGGGRFTGRLDVDPAGFAIDGTAAIDAPNGLGYRLARIAGPTRFEWRNRTITLSVNADGEGGSGAGLAPALLGGRPHGAVTLVWTPDNHFLIKSLQVVGRGLQVDGAGNRNLFGGGFSFRGKAAFSNFAAAHAGAKGLMNVAWTADESGGKPWGFTFDAGAKGFASGFDALDHLTGPSPTLKGSGVWDGHAFQVAKADLAGTAGVVTGTGPVGGDGSLGLKLTWAAKGPLDIGPLEIAGAAEGSGTVGGSISQPRADLDATLAAIDLPDLTLTAAHVTLSFLKGPNDTSGAFALTAASPYGPAHIDTGFSFVSDGLELSGLAAEAGGAHADGAVALRRGAASSANLTVTVGPGAFLSRGDAAGHLVIADAPGGPRASLKLSATGALTKEGDILVQKGTLTADGPLAQLPYQVQAQGFTPHGSWRATGSGFLGGEPGHYGGSFSGEGRLRDADFKTIDPVVVKLGRGGSSLSLLADVGGGRAEVEATQTGDQLQAKANLSGVTLGLVDQDFTGRLDADLLLQGQGARLGGVLDARLAGAGERGSKGEPGIDGTVKAVLDGSSVTLDAQLGNGQGLTSHAHLLLPAVASAAPFHIALVRTQAMRGDFAADGQVKPLWDLLMGGERSLAGEVHAAGTIGGTLADPQASGDAQITGGSFSDSATGLKLTGVALTAHLDQTAVDVRQFAGKDEGAGQVSGSGRVSLERGGASSFKLDLNRFRLLDNDIATATASGEATISRGADGAVKLTGALTIDRADLAANPPTPSGVTPMEVTEINRTPGAGGGHLTAVNSHAPAVGLDVTLEAARGVFLKGRGLNVELSLDAHVTGSTSDAQLSGVARVVRGDYDFAGKRFAFDTRGVVYLASSADDIRLDLSATRDDPSLTAVINITGTAARPKITLSSTPVLPTDEVLSQVLFGSSVSQLTAGDAAEMASAMTALAGGAGFDITSNLRSFAHLDRLAFGGDTAGAIVSGGKYLTNNVYLEIAGGANGPTGAVEWRIQKNLSLVSRLAGGAGGDSQISIRWRKDY